MCYYIKWNKDSSGEYQEVRPIFPIDVIPANHPMTTAGLGNSACDTFACAGGSGDQEADDVSFFWWDFEALSANQFLQAADMQTISMPGPNAFYAYSYPYSWSANTGRELSNTINMFFLTTDCTDTNCNKIYQFYILDKAWDGTGGDYQMSLTVTNPLDPKNSDPIDFHDIYATSGAGSPFPNSDRNAETFVHTTTFSNKETLPIMLRDDPWNAYEYDGGDVYSFNWHWLECCTDGMVLGPLYRSNSPYTMTYEGDCANMVQLAQGARISMWNPFGAAYADRSVTTSCTAADSTTYSEWIHYDVPMHQTCSQSGTGGIQIEAMPCDHADACESFDNCGECTSQPHCGWDETNSECKAECTDNTVLVHGGGTCQTCSEITNPHTCMCEPGCGWAPIDGKCISGTPDYPSEEVFIAQWETKGCGECPVDGPKSQCYRASYNEKNHFAGTGNYQMEYAVLPATNFPVGHPVENMGKAECSQVEATETWEERWKVDRDAGLNAKNMGKMAGAETLPGAVVFMAYDYPAAYSTNTGFEGSNSMVTYLVQGDDCQTYLVVLIDDASTSKGGYLQLEMVTGGGLNHVSPASSAKNPSDVGDMIAFQNDPEASGAGSSAVPVQFDEYTRNDENSTTIKWKWSSDFNDGGVIGPLPMNLDWSVSLSVVTKETRGLDTFKLGTYDAERCDIGFVTAPIQKATEKWGGIRYDAMECTEWCQRYTDCTSCVNDEQCQFYNGQCVSADAYVYQDASCARPTAPPATKLMSRWAESFERESVADGNCDSAAVIRFGLPSSLTMTCPCTSRYKYFVTVYDETMTPVYTVDGVAPRLDYQYTFVDLCNTLGDAPVIEAGEVYYVYSYLCIAQGTLGRDECSPVQIDRLPAEGTLELSPPPPSPPPP